MQRELHILKSIIKFLNLWYKNICVFLYNTSIRLGGPSNHHTFEAVKDMRDVWHSCFNYDTKWKCHISLGDVFTDKTNITLYVATNKLVYWLHL